MRILNCGVSLLVLYVALAGRLVAAPTRPSWPAVSAVPTYADDPLVSRTTPVRWMQLTELRAVVDDLRRRAGLAAYGWTELRPGNAKAVQLTELRSALAEALTILGRPVPTWTDTIVGKQTTMKALHLQEIRDATKWQEPAEVGGTITANTTWSATNSPYIVRQAVTVTNGATLTITPGTVVKFTTGTDLQVLEGATLVASGTPSQPIVFTSIKDDAVAGDTNGDGGTSQPGRGDWRLLAIGNPIAHNNQPAFGSVTNAIIRYGSHFIVRFSAPTLHDVTSTFMSGDGLYLEAPPAGPYTIARLTLTDNERNLQLVRVPASVTVRDSVLRRASFAAVYARDHTAAQLLNNAIEENRGSVAIQATDSPIVLHYNSITRNHPHDGHARGVHTTGAMVDARHNWWGASTGPTMVVDGTGQVGADTLYDPWLGQRWADAFKAGDHPWTLKAGVGVDVATGNFFLVETDVSIPTVGFPLEVRRTYNNKIAAEVTSEFGVGWTWNYGMNIDTVADGYGVVWRRDDGASTYFKRNPDNTFSSEEGVYDKLIYVPASNTYRMTAKDQSALVFNASGKLVAQVDAAGNTTTITRDTSGRVSQVIEPLGRKLSFEYSNSYISRITDDAGRSITYQRNPDGTISNVGKVDQAGMPFGVTAYVYGSGGPWQMTGFADGDGNRLEQTFDDAVNRRVAEQRFNSINGVVRFAYGPMVSGPYEVPESSTIVWDNRGRAHHYFYTKSNKVTDHFREEVPAGGTPEWIHEDAWRYAGYLVGTHTGPGGVTESTYDWNSGNLLRLVEPGGRATTHTYDAFNNRTSTTDHLGRRTSFEYNAQQRLVKATDALGRITQNEYDGRGLLSRSTDALGRLTTYSYDDYGHPKTVANHPGQTTSFTYDLLGRKTTETDPLGRRSGANYDARGNPLEVFNALDQRTSFSYDAKGRKVRRLDAEGRETRYEYDDARNALIRTIDAKGNTVDLTLDVAGNVASVRDPRGFVTTFEYDDQNRKIAETDPLGRTWKYRYIRRDLLSTVTDATGARTQYLYTSGNQLAHVNYPDGTTSEHIYDGVGNRVKLIDWTGETTWFYDALNRPTEVRKDGLSTKYAYDAVGNLTTLTYPGEKVVTYAYDDVNRLRTVTDWQGRVTTYNFYDGAGQLKMYTYPNGVLALRDYDLAGRLEYLQYAKSNVLLASMGYLFDRVGNRMSKRTTTGGDILEGYAYDELHRIRDAYYADTNTRVAYAYDASGNRTIKWEAVGGETYVIAFRGTYDSADQLQSDDTTTRLYDANGAQTVDGPRSYAWNAQRLLHETSHLGTVTSFVYDGDGRRVRQTHRGVVTDYVVNTVPKLPEVLMETTGSTTKYHIYGHELLYTIEPSGPHFLHADALGSTVVGTNSAGQEEARYSYDVFGSVRGTTNLNWTSRRFTGEECDDTGLTYLRARYYHPGMGRFLARDPFQMDVTDTQAVNRYTYVKNNPTNYIDPSGEIGVAAVIGAAATFLGNVQTANAPADKNTIAEALSERQILMRVATDQILGKLLTLLSVANTLQSAGMVSGSIARSTRVAEVKKIGRTLREGEVLDAAIRYLGPKYREIDIGVFRSADGLRQFRMTPGDLSGSHWRGPHVHFQTIDAGGRNILENIYVRIIP